MKTDLIYYHI